jgi:deoxyhypusine synthase
MLFSVILNFFGVFNYHWQVIKYLINIQILLAAYVFKLNVFNEYRKSAAEFRKQITFATIFLNTFMSNKNIVMSKGPVSNFIEHHYRHFNAAALMDAAKGYVTHLDEGGKMMITLAGAMSTAELGLSLAEMIRQDKVAIISCTGANLEEDIMNLVAHSHYKRVPNYRDLSPQEEWDLLENHYNRVTDTCIPEEEAFRRLQQHIHKIWKDADDKGERYFPHEYMYKMLLSGVLEQYYEIDPKNSWMLAAAKKNIPIVVPGWEDSTMGNIFASYIIKNEMKATTMKSGIEYMVWLADWYRNNSSGKGVGFFQIGGGIAGDFPICVVPMMYQDLEWHDVPFWSYFCQISDSTTSYGSYSGAVPNEKITWGKLDIATPKFIVESDATIVAPLIFAWVLGW